MPNIGPISIDAPICQAGLAGYSDRAMRMVARRRGCPYAVTEALLDVILLNGGEGLRKSIDISDEDHPVAGQIMGSEPENMARAATIIAGAGYDVVDLNFACPVKKIKNKSRGGHMLRDVPRGVEIMQRVRDAVPNSVTTVSLRRAFGEGSESDDELFALADAAFGMGYSATRVHGRTVEQRYLGRADWSVLTRLKQRYPDRTIIGSGDVFTAEDAVRMYRETGVDIVWVARGAIGNPWIFAHIRQLLAGATVLTPPTIGEQREALAEHFELARALHGESLAGRRMRKMGIKYARFHPQAVEVKRAFIEVSSLREWTATLDQFYGADGQGVWPLAAAADEVNEAAGAEGCEPAASPG